MALPSPFTVPVVSPILPCGCCGGAECTCCPDGAATPITVTVDPAVEFDVTPEPEQAYSPWDSGAFDWSCEYQCVISSPETCPASVSIGCIGTDWYFLFAFVTGCPTSPEIHTLNLRIEEYDCCATSQTLDVLEIVQADGVFTSIPETIAITSDGCGGPMAPMMAARPAAKKAATRPGTRRTLPCVSLGERTEFRAGCGGFGCLHECDSDRADVSAHLGGVMQARPSEDCQDCPGYVARK